MRVPTLAVMLLLAACRDESPRAQRATPATAARKPVSPPAATKLAPAGPPIHFAAGTTPGDLELSSRIDGCTLHLDYFSTWHGSRLRAVGDTAGPCIAPFELRLERLTAMVTALQVKLDRRPPFRYFGFYGRLADYEPMARRIALAAARAPDWDARAGLPKGGILDKFVSRIADGAYAEVAALFAGLGYTAHLAGVEKVIVLPAASLPYADWLGAQGVPRNARLPSDFIFGFRIALPVSRPPRRTR